MHMGQSEWGIQRGIQRDRHRGIQRGTHIIRDRCRQMGHTNRQTESQKERQHREANQRGKPERQT